MIKEVVFFIIVCILIAFVSFFTLGQKEYFRQNEHDPLFIKQN